MTASFKTWKVLPHGKLTEIDENILTVVGEIPMPIGGLQRRMTVARLPHGALASRLQLIARIQLWLLRSNQIASSCRQTGQNPSALPKGEDQPAIQN
jgi:hypothetical protein